MFVVRPVVAQDYGRWRVLWDGYNAFYGRQGETALDEAITRTTWARFLDDHEPVHAVVADADSDLVGLAHFLLHRSTIDIAATCYLQDLFTDGQQRGHGVGRALIDAVVERAGELGAGRLYWHTHQTNSVAIRLYDSLAERSGFLVYRRAL